MKISQISGLWSNIKKFDKILTIFHLQHFFKKGSVFSEHVYVKFNIWIFYTSESVNFGTLNISWSDDSIHTIL